MCAFDFENDRRRQRLLLFGGARVGLVRPVGSGDEKVAEAAVDPRRKDQVRTVPATGPDKTTSRSRTFAGFREEPQEKARNYVNRGR